MFTISFWDSLRGLITFGYSYLLIGCALGYKKENTLFLTTLTVLLHEFAINFSIIVSKYTIPKEKIAKTDQLNIQLFIVYGLIILWTLVIQGRHVIQTKYISNSLCKDALLIIIIELLSSTLILSHHVFKREINDILFIVLNMFELSGYIYLLTKNGFEQQMAIKNELEFNKRIYELKKQQYELSTYNQNELNKKCHDLKHYITFMANTHQSEIINQLTKVVKSFDENIKTGNSTLDILLTDQLHLAKQHNIEFHCIADGKLLEKMDDIDLYVLIGNIMDNAIEYFQNSNESITRNISLNIFRKNDFIVIREENPCSKTRPFKDGLPTSSKRDNTNHGYGLKSIKSIAEKYHGNLSVQFNKNLYSLTVLIPCFEG